MPVKEKAVVDRKAFIRRWMTECGLTYDVANQVYNSMITTFEDGVSQGRKIYIGELGALLPHWQEAREVNMGFRRERSKVVKQKQTFILDPRIRYKFKIFKEWMATRHINWYG